MTPTQEALRIGFAATKQSRGVPLWVEGAKVCAVVQPLTADNAEYQTGEGEREMSLIHIDREDLPEGVVRNSIFKNEDETTSHRVIDIDDHPTRTKVILKCETAPIED